MPIYFSRVFFLLITLLVINNADAQQFTLQGSASQTGPSTYLLTPDIGNQAGMATNYYPLDLTQNFSISFQLNFGTKDATGADGIAFMMSNTCNPTLVNGQGLGVGNTPNSLVVDFDTWDNGVAFNDIPQDHSGIYANGNFSVAGNIMDLTTVPVCLLPSCGNVEDGQWYDVRLQWDYINATTQKISVYFNNVLLSTSTQNHIANRFNNNTNVFWSVAASTGGSSNVQQFRVATSNNTFTYCEGENFTLTAPTLGSNYSWTANGSTTNTATYTATNNSVYSCTYVNYCGLNQTVSFTINVTKLNDPVISDNGPVCTGSDAIFTISGTPGYVISYTVNGGAVQTVTIGPGGTATVTINAVTADQVIVLSQLSDGTCIKNVNITDTIRLKQLSTPSISNNGPVCSGTDGIFTVSGTIGYSVSYAVNGGPVQVVTIGNGGTASIVVPAIASPQGIVLSMVNDGTCTASINVIDTIRIKPAPAAPSISNNGPVCIGKDGIFTIAGTAGDQVTYAINGAGNQQVNIGPGGTVQVTIPGMPAAATMNISSINNNGCNASMNISSTISLLPNASSVVDTSICDGQNYAGHSTPGTYVDAFPSGLGCDSIRTLHLTIIKTPRPNLGPDRVICPGESFPITPGNFSSYLWQDGTTQPIYTVTSPGIYTVSVNAVCGALTDELVVTRGICDIYFPSAFTPNKNGKNDLFKVLTDLKLQEYDLKVFDRWGEIVFQTADQSKGWDGTIRGTPVNSGIFVWTSSFMYNGSRKVMKGTVMLVR